MKLIGLEEHFVTDAVIGAWQRVPAEWQDPGVEHSSGGDIGRRLKKLGDERIADMDAAGLDVQVVWLTAAGPQSLAAEEASVLQVETNDVLAEAVRAHPDRLQGFATLATPAPDAAAKELSRAVTQLGFQGALLFGRTRGRNADDPFFRPIYEAAAHHRAPLYLHPQTPVPAVRQALYSGFGNEVDAAFAAFGLGWHYETGVQLLRLILSGVFDRFPDLQVVTGHWGEVVMFYLDRIDGLKRVAKIERPIPTISAPTSRSRRAGFGASATCAGRSRRSASNASCSRPITPIASTPTAPRAASSTKRICRRRTRPRSPTAIGNG